MKYKSMIKIVAILIPFLFFNKIVEAKVDPNGPYCYYTGQNGLYLKIHQDDIHSAYVDKAGLRLYASAYEEIINATGNGYCWISENSCSFMGALFSVGLFKINSEFKVPKWHHEGDKCPQYVIMLKGGKRNLLNIEKHYVYASDKKSDIDLISNFCSEMESSLIETCKYYTGMYRPNMTKEEYESALKGSIDSSTISSIADWEIEGNCSILGEINDSGWSTVDSLTGKTVEHQPSLAYIIHQAMNILRIIAIILLITLGIVDFAKAALAQNEEAMKKSQKTFVNRVIICVVIFLIPTFIDIIMGLANKFIETETCTEILNNL